MYNMKARKFIFAVALLVAGSISANAQLTNILKSAGSILGGVTGSSQTTKTTSKSSSNSGSGLLSALTTIFDKNKTATAEDLAGGTWKYTEPAVVFKSNSALQNIGGSVASAAIEKKLQSELEKYGIKKGTMTMTFDTDGNFTQTIAGKKLSGTYTISKNNVTLKYGGAVKQLIGTTQVDGNSLLIVTDATKLLSYMKVLGTLSGSSALKSASSLLGNVKDMEIGFRLQK